MASWWGNQFIKSHVVLPRHPLSPVKYNPARKRKAQGTENSHYSHAQSLNISRLLPYIWIVTNLSFISLFPPNKSKPEASPLSVCGCPWHIPKHSVQASVSHLTSGRWWSCHQVTPLHSSICAHTVQVWGTTSNHKQLQRVNTDQEIQTRKIQAESESIKKPFPKRNKLMLWKHSKGL